MSERRFGGEGARRDRRGRLVLAFLEDCHRVRDPAEVDEVACQNAAVGGGVCFQDCDHLRNIFRKLGMSSRRHSGTAPILGVPDRVGCRVAR